VEPFGLDPETALKLIQMLLRGAGYFFAGFAVLGLSTYVVFLCLEIFASQPRAKTKIAEIPPQVGYASVVEQTYDPVPAETPLLTEAASFIGEELMQEGAESGGRAAQFAVSP
jgi:hypothetical protein